MSDTYSEDDRKPTAVEYTYRVLRDVEKGEGSGGGGGIKLVVPRASPMSGEHSEFRVTTAHAEPYHLSFSTKKDCIFPRNTIVNIDVAPRLPVRHIIT
jgi:hypothetical protein